MQRIAEWIARRWDLITIPYTSAPINPETGISPVMRHQEFTLGTGKICPGPVVMNATNDLIARAKANLQKHQSGDVTSPSPEPDEPTEAQYVTPKNRAWMTAWKGEPALLNRPGRRSTMDATNIDRLGDLVASLGILVAACVAYGKVVGPYQVKLP